MGEFATSRINRRALLFHSGSAAIASTVAATALGTEQPDRTPELSNRLQALIEAHKTAYAAFGKALHDIRDSSSDSDRASQEEESALLAICGYAAAGEGDRVAKAQYLLEIEARGELDLANLGRRGNVCIAPEADMEVTALQAAFPLSAGFDGIL